jgi:hypothetical protein
VKFPNKSRSIQTSLTGILKDGSYISDSVVRNDTNILEIWKSTTSGYVFQTKEELRVPSLKNIALKEVGEKILNGELFYFNNQWIWLGKNYDWVTNSKTNYSYSSSTHWSGINELDQNAGDIKYVWEKSRFSYLMTLIRYDYHFNIDCSKYAMNEILSWIEQNPVNRGPNWVCSQEISLRLLNWYFIIHYYKNHASLTPETFKRILQSIYDQILHVYSNIKFSLKTVRNNHALTESLLLYISGHLFPFFREAGKWKQKGKKWFEDEIAYQIYDDGSYIQYSMNYHRVAIQLLTLGLLFAEEAEDAFDQVVYDKAMKSLNFLFQLHNNDYGYIPNYGHNDGALFFPFNDLKYADYRPQLNALHYALYKKHVYEESEVQEDAFWFGADSTGAEAHVKLSPTNKFMDSGYFMFRDDPTFTFIRCGNHKNRPGQADNLHLDISLNGKSLFRDGGTYQYNADPKDIKYFFGTGSHNSIMLGRSDQMKKAGRFIWLYWTQAEQAKLDEDDKWIVFEGRIKAFRHIGKDIYHQRIVRKKKNELYWEVEDLIINKPTGKDIRQIWHPNPDLINQIDISALDKNNKSIPININEGMFAPGYGLKESAPEMMFASNGDFIRTIIQVS